MLALRVSDDNVKALNKALGERRLARARERGGPVRLDLGQVVYVRSESSDLRVGFGA